MFDFIVGHTKQHGYSPTRREIGEARNIGLTAVLDHLHCIERKGYIQLQRSGTARAIVVLAHYIGRDGHEQRGPEDAVSVFFTVSGPIAYAAR